MGHGHPDSSGSKPKLDLYKVIECTLHTFGTHLSVVYLQFNRHLSPAVPHDWRLSCRIPLI